MPEQVKDRELEQYRNLLSPPDRCEDGFGWTTVAGVFFCGLVMMPGAIYLGLMTGGGIGSAASWVTLILFGEVARRAMKSMSRANLVVLLHAAGSMVSGGLFGGLVLRAYLVSSDAMRDAGMRNAFPSWYCPSPDSEAIVNRDLLHRDWLVPVGLIVFLMVIGMVKRYSLGYFLFRLTSDVEKLPFPMAPISAQGTLALAEAQANLGEKDKQQRRFSPWRLFSLGASFGLVFGLLQVGIPSISGLLLSKPFFLLPQPFLDTTTLTEGILPATPTGLAIDLGVVLMGMVLPFWAIVGTFCAIALTALLNPVLHATGVLSRWQPGMDTVNTTFANSMDFWMSFGIGTALGIAVVSVWSTARDVSRSLRENRAARREAGAAGSIWTPPRPGRGDYPLWVALGLYVLSAAIVVYVCNLLVPGLLVFLVGFAFFYTPFISYVNARLLGTAGQTVDIPFLREGAFIVSGAKGVDIWLAPIPIENYGGMAQSYRVNELTGVSFWSLLKTDMVVMPVNLLLSLLLWGFIWKSSAIPSDLFPAAQINWELQSKQTALLYTSTFVPEGEDPAKKDIRNSQFWKAVHGPVIAAGGALTVVVFLLLSSFGLPVMLVYGAIRGLGGIPHTMLLEILGALLGRYWLQKRFGAEEFLKMAPTLLAGYFTGVGLISMATVALTLIKSAVSGYPY